MRQFIIDQLMQLDVINEKKVHEYVDFCLENDIGSRKKLCTSFHHILPKADTLPFRQYADLKINKWNGVHLKFKDHYYAHYILAKAVNEIAVLRAFLSMKYQEITLGRINEDDLVDADHYDEVMQRFCKKMSAKMKEIMPEQMNAIYAARDEEYRIKKSQKSAKTMHSEGTYKKISERHKEYQNEIMPSGLTRAQETGIKVGQTRKEMFDAGRLKKLLGSKNPAAIKVNIYDANDNLMFECNGNFTEVCKNNKLPISFLKKSYQTDNRRFTKTQGMSQTFYDVNKQYDGWYAEKM